MKKISILSTFLFTSVFAFSQNAKVAKLKFCGYHYTDTALLRKHFQNQIDFLNINDSDTIVDIGSSSGAYIGALNVIAPFKKAHFILVDIDSNCLNKTKLKNMIAHYEGLKGKPFENTISFVNNSYDSLYVPLNSFSTVFIFNTLHEIDDKASIVKQISSIIKINGQLVVAEIAPTSKRTIHGGCNKPLLGEEELINLFKPYGFVLTKKANLQSTSKKIDKHPYFFYVLTKMS
jgi:ubiquinone/menaquinone biosynthesis C-methylase UbiE